MLLKGKLESYFATGEPARPQFIGDKALDENGMIVNYDYIYDIENDDEITLITPFLNEGPITVLDPTYSFLFILSMMAKSPIEARYKPAKGHKSWGKIMKEYHKKLGDQLKKS